MVRMMQEKTKEFTPYNQFKPFHKITFIGYEFTVNGKNIEFEDRISPEQLGLQNGDMFVAKVTDDGHIILERAEFE